MQKSSPRQHAGRLLPRTMWIHPLLRDAFQPIQTPTNKMNANRPLDAAHPLLKPAVSSYYDAAVAKAFFESCGRREKFAAGTTLFVENEKSNKKGIFTKPINAELFNKPVIHRMYLLTAGEVELSAGGKLIDTVGADEVFGEMAVISEIPGSLRARSARSATATAKRDCTGYSVDVNETEAGLKKTPEFALMLMSVMFERLRFLAAKLASREVEKARSSTEPVFDTATVTALENKLERATVVRFAEGRKIMREGQSGVTMYIVMEGKVSIAIGDKTVEELGPGGVFGEMALVDKFPRTASATADTECALLSINRDTLIALVKSDQSVGMAMMRCVADRIRYMNSLFA